MATASSSLHRLNETQLYLLRLFEHPINDKQLKDIKELISNYLASQVDDLSEQVWEERGFSEETMEQILRTHLRTPYHPK